MAGTTASVSLEVMPPQSKKTPVVLGSELVVSFISDFCGCKLLPRPNARFTSNGAFTAHVFLLFNPPDYLGDFDGLLSTAEGEREGLALRLSMYTRMTASEMLRDWEDRYVLINGRIIPNKLTFKRYVDGLEGGASGWTASREAVALPRDDGCQRYDFLPWPI